MTLIDDKEPKKRDSMIFPYRWFDTLEKLEETDLRQMLSAIRQYSQNGIKPSLTGAMSALWNEFCTRIDYDNNKYQSICERNKHNAQNAGRPKKENPKNPVDYFEIQRNPEKSKKSEGEGDGEGDGENKERTVNSSKETSETFSLTQNKSNQSNFKKWDLQTFKDNVAQYPEYSMIAEEFVSYWTEPDPKGKMRFQLQKTWETKRRLNNWFSNNLEKQSKTGVSYIHFDNRPEAYDDMDDGSNI